MRPEYIEFTIKEINDKVTDLYEAMMDNEPDQVSILCKEIKLLVKDIDDDYRGGKTN